MAKVIPDLKTRISLKYDTYANWTNTELGDNKGANLVLLAGELGICRIDAESQGSNVVPTVLFKVGGEVYPEGHEKAGQLKAFKDLPWASAKAADVYSWAKATTVKVDGKSIKFVNIAVDESGEPTETVVKDLTLNFATPEEVSAITGGLESRIAAIEGSIGNGDVADQFANVVGRLEALEGEDGLVATTAAATLASAQSYADGKASAAESAAKAHADSELAKDRERLSALEAADSAQDDLISANATAIQQEASDRATAINNLASIIGGEYSTTSTVHAAILAAKAEGTTAQQQVSDLTAGQVAANTRNIATNAADIALLKTGLADEISAREGADNALSARLTKVEAFFGDADREDGGYEHLDEALDTLVEIQTYLNGEGDGASSVLDSIAKNASDIVALQNIVKDGGTLEVRVDQAEADVAAVAGRADTLESIVKGYITEGSIKAAIEAAHQAGTDAANAASVADGKAVQAQNEIDALELIIGDANSGLIQLVNTVKGTADSAASEVSRAHGRLDTAEGAITALQNIVSNGNDTNAKLREAITELQGIVKTGDDSNANLRTTLTNLQNIVNDTDTGLAKTKSIADAAASLANTNAGKIAAIEADYLTAADEYIFNCGSSTEMVHVKQDPQVF